MITKSASLIFNGLVVTPILLPGVAFSSSMAFLVSPVPNRIQVFGKCFDEGEAYITKTNDADRSFYPNTPQFAAGIRKAIWYEDEP